MVSASADRKPELVHEKSLPLALSICPAPQVGTAFLANGWTVGSVSSSQFQSPPVQRSMAPPSAQEGIGVLANGWTLASSVLMVVMSPSALLMWAFILAF